MRRGEIVPGDAVLPFIEPKAVDDLLGVVVMGPPGRALQSAADTSIFGRIARSPLVIPIVDPVTGAIDLIDVPRESAILTADESQIRSRVLFRPRLSLLSGEEHEIFVGNNVPVPVAAAGAANPLETRQTVVRINFPCRSHAVCAGDSTVIQPSFSRKRSVRRAVDFPHDPFSASVATLGQAPVPSSLA